MGDLYIGVISKVLMASCLFCSGGLHINQPSPPFFLMYVCILIYNCRDLVQAFCDLEPIYSYEGTYDINSLVTGREITGIASFKPAVSAKSRM